MNKQLTAELLVAACHDNSFDDGIKIVSNLVPLAGDHQPVRPATYAKGEIQRSARWLKDENGKTNRESTPVVVIDNEPSQANRHEHAQLIFRKELGLPHLLLDLSDQVLPPHLPKALSSLQFPHRNADAYLRDSLLDGVPFLKTVMGRGLMDATADNPGALFQWAPTALLYGFWQSHLGKKRSQAKLARSWSSTIVGIDPASDSEHPTRINGTKGDPFNLNSSRAVSYNEDNQQDWSLGAAQRKALKGEADAKGLSAVGHGQIPFTLTESAIAGMSFRSIEQVATVSFAALRRIECGTPEQNAAGRALLVALGIAGHCGAFSRSFSLRSGCDLRTGSSTWTWESASGDTEVVVPTFEQAKSLFADCVARAEQAGLLVGSHWADEVVLKPNSSLAAAITDSWPEVD